MRYYQTTMVVTAESGNLHALHRALDSFVREQYLGAGAATLLRHEATAVPQYGFRAVPRDEDSSIVLLRSFQPIGLPDERELEISLEKGDRIHFQYLPCVSTKANQGRTTRLLPEESLAQEVIQPRLARAGLEAKQIEVRGVDKFDMRKPQCKPFFLAGAHVRVDATVSEPDSAMAAFVTGIGHKTAFGFGLPLQLTVSKAEAEN
jgi:hypothetical protein